MLHPSNKSGKQLFCFFGFSGPGMAQAWARARLGPGPWLRLIQYTSQPGGPQGAGGYLHIIMADKFYPHQSKMGHVAKTIWWLWGHVQFYKHHSRSVEVGWKTMEDLPWKKFRNDSWSHSITKTLGKQKNKKRSKRLHQTQSKTIEKTKQLKNI